MSRPAPGKKRRLTRLARQGRIMTAVLTSRVRASSSDQQGKPVRPAPGKKRRWTRTAGMTITAASASRGGMTRLAPVKKKKMGAVPASRAVGQDQPQEGRGG